LRSRTVLCVRHVLRLHAARALVDQRHRPLREGARRLGEAEGGRDGPGVEDAFALPEGDRIEPEVEAVEHIRGQQRPNEDAAAEHVHLIELFAEPARCGCIRQYPGARPRRSGQGIGDHEFGDPVERAPDVAGLVRPVGRKNVVGLPAEEQGVDPANLLADGSAGLVVGHGRLPTTEGEVACGVFFAAARRLIDAVEGDKQVRDDNSHAPILEQGSIAVQSQRPWQTGAMLLDELVRTTDAVAATRSRLAKVDALAGLLRRLDPGDIAAAVGLLIAKPRQGRVGIGWRGMTAALGEPAAEPSLTVADLDAALDRLLAAAGAGSAAERAATLRTLTAAATEREQAFISGVLLGELRTGALEGVLTDAIARAADKPGDAVRRAAMLSGDLGGTALLAITGAAAQLDAVGLVVGRPVQPMLAATASSAGAALEVTGEASVEYKLDGARIQVHRVGDDVRIYTRTLAEVTHRLPEVVEVVRGLPVRDVILDGETLALDEDGGPRPFQETMSRFGADAARGTVLHPWFFDVLHIDGRDLLDEPLSTRIGVLERIAPGHRMPGEITADADVAERVSRDALAAGHEGVVVKAIGSAYAAGRRGSNWIKVKPVHTYDLVVLACEWGSGRRTGL
jgi:DNA ligase-1